MQLMESIEVSSQLSSIVNLGQNAIARRVLKITYLT
jgi:hypothetical protein